MKLFLTTEDGEFLRKRINEKEAKLSQLGLGLGDAMSRTGSFPASSPEYAAVHLDMKNLQQSIDFLKRIFDKYQQVEQSEISGESINHYSLVTVSDETGKTSKYYLTLAELDKKLPKGVLAVTPESPVGKALLGHRLGDTVEIALPSGNTNLEIVGLDLLF